MLINCKYYLLWACLIILITNCGIRPTAEQEEDIGIVVSISDRELYIYKDGERQEAYSVAVGKPTHPTPTGNFEIYQIDWNLTGHRLQMIGLKMLLIRLLGILPILWAG